MVYFGVLYGIFKENGGQAAVHNRIYEQIIYNYMVSKIETAYVIGKRTTTAYLAKDALDMEHMLAGLRTKTEKKFWLKNIHTKRSSYDKINIMV